MITDPRLTPLPPGWSRRQSVTALLSAILLGTAACAGKKKAASEEPDPDDYRPSALGDALKELRRRIKKGIDDKEKRMQLLALADQLQDLLVDLRVKTDDWRAELNRLSPEEQEQRELLVRISDQYNDSLRAHLKACARVGFEARALTTPDDWEILFPPLPARGENS